GSRRRPANGERTAPGRDGNDAKTDDDAEHGPPRRQAMANNGNVIDESKKVKQFLSFPVLTRELGLPSPGGGGTTAPSAGLPVAQVVEAALRDVLGWRPRAGDTAGFVAALEQSFRCQETTGRAECTWTPHSYTVGIQANMGALTGAQASLLSRGRNMLD